MESRCRVRWLDQEIALESRIDWEGQSHGAYRSTDFKRSGAGTGRPPTEESDEFPTEESDEFTATAQAAERAANVVRLAANRRFRKRWARRLRRGLPKNRRDCLDMAGKLPLSMWAR